VFPGKSVLSVIIIEQPKQYSTPERLTLILQAVSDLFAACSVLQGQPDSRLSVIGCDSGSDKSFDFLGAAKVIECVKEVILSLWDRIVFYRERKVENRLDLIAQSLPILDQINEMHQKGSLGAEQTEILRRQIVKACTDFVSTGALIPEISAKSFLEPRAILAPEPKLLSAPGEGSRANSGGDGSTAPDEMNELDDALTKEERAQLRRLMEKSRGLRDAPEGA
jgi:hypothetical protein